MTDAGAWRRTFAALVGTVVFLLLLASPAAADDPPTIILPSDAALPAGTYRATVDGPNGPVVATVSVPAPAGGSPSASPSGTTGTPAAGTPAGENPNAREEAPTESSSGFLPVLLAVLATALLIGGTVLVRRKIVEPGRQRSALKAAVALIGVGDYRAAIPALSAVETKLSDRLRVQAGFFTAFALVQIGEVDEASLRLAGLNRANPSHPEIAYLLAHLRVERREYDAAEPVLAPLRGRFTDRARKLYGVVQYHRGLEALRDGRVDAAAQLFQEVETLGDFRDHLPDDLRNRHVALGARALFDKDVVGARKHFEDLERAAPSLPDDEREQMLALADVGTALAAWIENRPGAGARIDALLTTAVARLDPDGATALPWPDTDPVTVADRLAAMQEAGTDGELSDLDRVLRDLHFLRGMALLRDWAGKPTKSKLTEAVERFACARERDPDFSDTYLVVGLLRYYLADSDAERAVAATVLARAQLLGARDPEVLRVLNRQARITRAGRDAVDAYLQVLDQYVADGSIREQVRADVVRRLSRFRRVRDWDGRPELVEVRAAPPTVAEMNDRSELLRVRVSQLLAAPGSADLVEAHELVRNLEADSKRLAEHARSVEQKEANLLVIVGDRLLVDHER
ncbi:tetratricopeptide repeat protein [Alloactinosynnema sp. L-07]|uniref:tetratricopeptide repeat protein n=1 Tax=Alloactinosynnema sp. L-07 TaxID=1653480 RepID=UPI0006B4B5DE|nr:tetratricopeptide repeat protein [Alloactinosynnema sp. L-07]